MAGVFLNYRVRDSATTCAFIRDRLSHEFGADLVFRDSDSMQAGERYPDSLRKALSDADVLVSIVGPDWLALTDQSGRRLIDRDDDWVRYEIKHALARGIPIIPVLLDGPGGRASRPDAASLPADLREFALRQSMSVVPTSPRGGLDALVRRLVELAPTLLIPHLFTQPPPGRTAANAPSTLLRPEYEIVPMAGHLRPLADLRAWIADAATCSVRLLLGGAGSGKTRLAQRLGTEVRGGGWVAGVVRDQAPATEIIRTTMVDKPLLIIVDDVETRAEQLIALAEAIVNRAERSAAPGRLLLLATSAGDWLRHLRGQADPRVSALFGTVSEDNTVSFTPTATDRQTQFGGARRAFAAALVRPDPGTPPPDRAPESLLETHAAALVAVAGEGNGGLSEQWTPPLARLMELDLRHARRTGVNTAPARLAELGALATLCGPGSPEEATALLERLPTLLDAPADQFDEPLAQLKSLYPGPYEINPIRPDLLGEYVLATTFGARPALAAALARHCATDQLTRALTVLGRALGRHPALRRPLVDILLARTDGLSLSMDVAGRLADPVAFNRVVSTLINDSRLDMAELGRLREDVQRLGTSANSVRAAWLAQFVHLATKPIRDSAQSRPSAPIDRLVEMLQDGVLGSLDPAKGRLPQDRDGNDIVPGEWLNELWRHLIEGER